MYYLVSYCITMLILYIVDYVFKVKKHMLIKLKCKYYYMFMMPLVIIGIGAITIVDYTLLQQPISAGIITAVGTFVLLTN